ncbi:hypothetical protein ACFL9T_04055 [Thermodesulfobacteriota bacterium]
MMEKKCRPFIFLTSMVISLLITAPVNARIKLAALPERGQTVVRLDNPKATLIEEERILTLQQGLNRVDFSWKGVNIDVDSIRLNLLSKPQRATLLNVSYPPGEAALVWEIHSDTASEVKARISYLLSYIDHLIAYKWVADKEETTVLYKSFVVLRNFSGENFEKVSIHLEGGRSFEKSINHGETTRYLYFSKERVPIEKRWTFDAGKLPWDPEKLDGNVGIPVQYRVKHIPSTGIGTTTLPKGKVRVYQDDGGKSTILLGEDSIKLVSYGENMDVYIGDSRDIVVTQRKMQERRINVRRNRKNKIILYDTDELIKATLKNFKDKPANLTMIQYIPGEWEMKECNFSFKRKDAYTLEFDIPIPAKGAKELVMHYQRKNIQPGRRVK